MGVLTKNEIISEIYKIIGIGFLLITCAFVMPTLYKDTRPQLPIFYNSIDIFNLSFLLDYPRMFGSYLVWFLACYVMFRISYTFWISGWKISKMEKNLEQRLDLTLFGGILCGFAMIYSLLLLLQIIQPTYFFPSLSIKLAPSIEYMGDADKSILYNSIYFWVMLEVIRLVGARTLKVGIKQLVSLNEIPEPNIVKSLLRRFKITSILRRFRIIR